MHHIVDELLVTADAVLLEDSRIARGDLNGLVKILEREGLGVSPAVVGFGDHLGNKIVGQMAINALGHGMMRRLLPGSVLVVHDVAVGARRRV